MTRSPPPLHSTYGCIFKEKEFPPSLESPHPFPLAGLPGDKKEMAIHVCQLLLEKIQPINADRKVGKQDVIKIKQDLWRKRGQIWKDSKVLSWISPEEGQFSSEEVLVLLSSKIIKGDKVSAKEDPFQMWSTVQLLSDMIGQVSHNRKLSAMNSPVNTFPEESRHLVEQAMSSQYLAIARDILHSLSTEVINYKDILKKICGGDRNKQCSFCGKKMVVMRVCFAHDKNFVKNSAVCLIPSSRGFTFATVSRAP